MDGPRARYYPSSYSGCCGSLEYFGLFYLLYYFSVIILFLFPDFSANAVRRQVVETTSAHLLGNRRGKENKGSRWMFYFSMKSASSYTNLKERKANFLLSKH